MGVDTRAILTKGTTLEQIVEALGNKYSTVKVNNGSSSEYFFITFLDGKDARQLCVSFDPYASYLDSGLNGTYISLGMWGNSIQIAKYLCETFGGYIDENDCDEEDYYIISIDKIEQSKEFTKMDLFRNKVIKELGFENLKKAIALLEEFKHI